MNANAQHRLEALLSQSRALQVLDCANLSCSSNSLCSMKNQTYTIDLIEKQTGLTAVYWIGAWRLSASF